MHGRCPTLRPARLYNFRDYHYYSYYYCYCCCYPKTNFIIIYIGNTVWCVIKICIIFRLSRDTSDVVIYNILYGTAVREYSARDVIYKGDPFGCLRTWYTLKIFIFFESRTILRRWKITFLKKKNTFTFLNDNNICILLELSDECINFTWCICF